MEKSSWRVVKTSGGYGVLKPTSTLIKKTTVVRSAADRQPKASLSSKR